MKKGAMVRIITLLDGIIYYNFTWTYLGFAGGSKMFDKFTDYIPDAITHLHRLGLN